MTAQLQKPPRLFTPEEYLRMERLAPYKSVYFNGRIFVMPGGTFNHSRIAGNVYFHIENQLRNGPCVTLTSDMRVKIPAVNIYCYPDVTVVCGEPEFEGKREDVLLNPSVVVEVLSPTTKDYDLEIKLEHYLRSTTLRELVYIQQDEPRVMLHSRINANTWETKFVTGLDAILKFETIPVTIPLSEIYNRASFKPESEEL
ncbi:Uma2 family endonuclease [soil metagenome]